MREKRKALVVPAISTETAARYAEADDHVLEGARLASAGATACVRCGVMFLALAGVIVGVSLAAVFIRLD